MQLFADMSGKFSRNVKLLVYFHCAKRNPKAPNGTVIFGCHELHSKLIGCRETSENFREL